MRNRFLLLIALLALLLPGLMLAQGDLTLEGLAQRLAALSGRLETVEQRVTDLESGLGGVGYCAPSVTGYHPLTLAGIAEEFPNYEVELHPDISFLHVNMETGEITVRWQSFGFGGDEIVIEYYGNNCQWTGFQFKAGGG